MAKATPAVQKELKSIAFADTHGLRDKITLNDSGKFEIPADLHQTIVLDAVGITAEQERKRQKLDGELLAGVTLVCGELSHEAFGKNVELSEVGFSYNIGPHTKASGIFDRSAKDHTVVHVETRFQSGELKRVMTHLNGLYDDVNS